MLLKPTELSIDPLDPFAKDAFERKDVVESLVRLIEQLSGPFVIAIDSPWGTGKTTFLKMLKACLQKKQFACLHFNAWETDFAEDPLIAFVGEMDGLIREISGVEADRLKSLDAAKRIAGAVARRAIPAAIKVATLGALDFSGEVEKIMADATGTVTADAVDVYLKEKKLIEEFHKQIDQALALAGENGKRLPMVIFVDEIDRCRPLYAIELLERIKHLFNVSNAIFLLAVDKQQMGISLGAVYGHGFNANEYLRRFFDLEFKLSQVDSMRFCESLIERMGLDEFFSARKNSEKREEGQHLKAAFRDLSKLLGLTARAQEHYMSLLTMAMMTTPSNEYFHTHLTALMAAVRIGANDVYEKVARRGGSVMEIFDLLEKLKPGAQMPNTIPILQASVLAARANDDKRAQAEYDKIVARSKKSNSIDTIDEEAEQMLYAMRDHEIASASISTVVKRIDLAVQFVRGES